MMKKILIRADDLGYSRAVNYGIFDSIHNGIINNVGVMVNMPSTQQGLDLLRHEDIDYGMHTNISNGKPILPASEVPSLVDKNGNFKVGSIDNFNSGDLLTRTYSNDVESFVKDDKGNQLFKPASGNNRSRNVPIINVIENGKIKRGSLNILSNKRSKNNNTYGIITGGRVILEAGNERRLVSGSLNDIEKQFNDIKKRHGVKTVRMYTLDNGTYNRALRTKNRIISASDLQAYDNLNSSGGSFMYLLNNKNFNTDTLTNETDYEKLIKYLSKNKRTY